MLKSAQKKMSAMSSTYFVTIFFLSGFIRFFDPENIGVDTKIMILYMSIRTGDIVQIRFS